jgi:hypothetical protein
MSYLGNNPTQQAFTPAVDVFSGNGSTTAFTLSRQVASVAQVEAVIENVVQSPVDAYTVSGNTITFTSAPPSGSSNIYVRYTSPITQVVQPTDGSVGLRQLSGDLQNATYGMKNRIINGAMIIDQRNAGASVTGITTTQTYPVDRFYVLQASGATLTAQRSSTAPAGFTSSLALTVTSAGTPSYSFFQQSIEGFSVADMGWGTANAKTSTLSFWVQSSIAGTYAVSLQSSDYGYSYVATYTITSANTWQQVSLTIPGNTTGNWYTDNRSGLNIRFCLVAQAGAPTNTWAAGSYNGAPTAVNWTATNGATFYITGVQLEKGSTATSFDYRPYGTELALCQRYYYKWINNIGAARYNILFQAYSSSAAFGKIFDLPVTMRAQPTATASGTFTAVNATGSITTAYSNKPIDSTTAQTIATGAWTGSSGLVAGNCTIVETASNAYIEVSAEL